MMRKKEKKELRFLQMLFLLGLCAIPFWVIKASKKDSIIIFLLTGFFSSMIDLVVTAKKCVDYPLQVFGRTFNISILFDYLLFPTCGVFYNQWTYHSGIWGAIWKALIFSGPMTILEFLLEKRTNLVSWIRWHWYQTLLLTSISLWATRLFIGVVRGMADKKIAELEDHVR